MPIKLNSTGGGSVSIDVPSTASTFTLTAPARSGTIITNADANTVTQAMVQTGFAGNGPAFSVYRNGAQNLINAAYTKINFEIEDFDTANCYDNSSNYRFTPNVTGYYLISLAVACSMPGASASTLIGLIYKNGSAVAQQYQTSSGVNNTYASSVSKLIYMNGTTDYIEGYGYQNNGADRALGVGASFTYMTGFLARSA